MKDAFERFADTAHTGSTLKRRAVRGGAATLGSQAANFVLQIGSVAVLGRLLVPDDFGVVGIVSSATAIALAVRGAGVAEAAIQKPELTRAQFDWAFWFNAAVAFVTAGIIAACAPLLSLIYGDDRLTLVAVASAGVLVLMSLPSLHRSLLKRRLMLSRLAGVQVLAFATGVAAAIYSAWAGAGYWSLVIMQAARHGSALLMVAFMCPVLPRLPRRGSGARTLLSDGGFLTGGAITSALGRNLDNLLIGFFSGKAMLGEYTRAYALVMMPMIQLVGPVGSVATPALSRLQDQPARYARAYARLLTPVLMITTPGIAVLIVVADPMIRTLLGEGWEQTPALFRWLAVSSILQPFTVSLTWLMISQGRAREHFRNQLLNTALLVTGFVASAPFGAEILAMVYGLSGLLIRSPLITMLVLRKGPVSVRQALATTLPGVLAAAVAAATAWLALDALTEQGHTVSFLGATAAGIAVTGVTYLIVPSARHTLLGLRDFRDAMRSEKKPEATNEETTGDG